MKITVFWDVASCGLVEINRGFEVLTASITTDMSKKINILTIWATISFSRKTPLHGVSFIHPIALQPESGPGLLKYWRFLNLFFML
jgi:hypothetical protein